MDNKTFKLTIKKLAVENGFKQFPKCYFRESSVSLIGLELQKSNYSNYYYLNIQNYIQGYHGLHYTPSIELLHGDKAVFFRRQKKEYNSAFELDNDMSDEERLEQLNACFANYIGPLVEQLLTREGIKNYVEDEQNLISPERKKKILTVLGYET